MAVHLKQKENILEHLYSLHQLNRDEENRVPYTDLDIICNDGVVNVHSIILIGKSSIFKDYFMSLTPCEKSSMTLHLPDYNVKNVILAVHFLYTGESILSARKQKVVYKILQDLNIDTRQISSSPYSSNNEQVRSKPYIYHCLFDLDDDNDLEILNEVNNDHQDQELINSPSIPQVEITTTTKDLIPEKVQMEIQPPRPSLQKQQQSSILNKNKNYITPSSSSSASTNNTMNENINLGHSLPNNNNKQNRPQIQSKAVRVVQRAENGIKIVTDNDEEENTNTTSPPQLSSSTISPSNITTTTNNNNNNANDRPLLPTSTKEARKPFPTTALKVLRTSTHGFKVVQAEIQNKKQSSEDCNNDDSTTTSGKQKARQSIQTKCVKVVRNPGEGVKVVDVDNQNSTKQQQKVHASNSTTSSSSKGSHNVSSMKIVRVGVGIKIVKDTSTKAAATTASNNSEIPEKKGVGKQNGLKRHHSLLMTDSETESSNKTNALASSESCDSDFNESYSSDIDHDDDIFLDLLKTQPLEKVVFPECRVVLHKLSLEDDDKYQAKLISLQSQLLPNPNYGQEESQNGDVEMEENVVISEETTESVNPLHSNETAAFQNQELRTTSTKDKSNMNAPDINMNPPKTSVAANINPPPTTTSVAATNSSSNEILFESTSAAVINNPSSASSSEQIEKSHESAVEQLEASVQNTQQVIEKVPEPMEEEVVITTLSTNTVVFNEQTTLEITQNTNSDVHESSTVTTFSNDTQVLVAAPTALDSPSFQSVENSNILDTPEGAQRNDNTEMSKDSSRLSKQEHVFNATRVSEFIDLTEEEEGENASTNSPPALTIPPSTNNNDSNNNGVNNGTSQPSPNIMHNNNNTSSSNPLVIQNNNSIGNINNNGNGIPLHSCDKTSTIVQNSLNFSPLQIYFEEIFPSLPTTQNAAVNGVKENNMNNNNPSISPSNNQQQSQEFYQTPLDLYFTEQFQQEEEILTPPQQVPQIHPPPLSSDSIPQQIIQAITEPTTPLQSNSYFECSSCHETFSFFQSLDSHPCFGD